MKEATGELNSTLIVVIAIAGLSAFFFTIIWPMIRDDLKYDSNCANAVCEQGIRVGNVGLVCSWRDRNNTPHEISCPYTG